MPLTREHERMLSGLNDAAEQQPWRCSGCGRAVRPHQQPPDLCKCIAPWFGAEVTSGQPRDGVTPRVVGPAAVEKTKQLLGVCMAPGCVKQVNHKGEHQS